MSDLVSGLLAHLDALEREHHRAAEEMRQAARMKIGNALGDYVLASIADGLRLCRAHRDIVKRFQWAWERRNTGTDDEQALRQMYVIAMIDVLSELARGLGVEEQSSE